MSKESEAECVRTLETCRTLYNLALEQRIMLWKQFRKSISGFDQEKQLPELTAAFPEFTRVNCNILANVLRRLEIAYVGFYRRCKQHGKAGFPRFKSSNRYDSFTLRKSGWKVMGDRLRLTNIGVIEVRLHRPIQGRVKTVTIYRSRSGKWFVSFVCDQVQEKIFPETDKQVGIDVGSKVFCVDSDGLSVLNPKYLRKAQAQLRRRDRMLCRRVKGSKRRSKARILLAKAHERVANQRKDFLNKLSTDYIRRYSVIAVEELDFQQMQRKKHTAKAIADAGWGMFISMMTVKAGEAGRTVVKVPPKGTTENCSRCQTPVPKSIDRRVHKCPSCGLKLGRDLNAAQNILSLGHRDHALTKSDVSSSVA